MRLPFFRPEPFHTNSLGQKIWVGAKVAWSRSSRAGFAVARVERLTPKMVVLDNGTHVNPDHLVVLQ